MKLESGYDADKGIAGAVYRYIGAPDSGAATHDLSTENYNDLSKWKQVLSGGPLPDLVRVSADYNPTLGDAGSVYRYLGPSANLDLGTQDYKNTANWQKITQ